jgi:hypothetical protein
VNDIGACVDVNEQKSATPTYQFTPPSWGEYIVTLKLTDGYGQTEYAQRYLSVKDESKHFVRMAFDYPTSPLTRTAKNTRSGGDRVYPSDIPPEQIAPGVDTYDATFPFVMHKDTVKFRLSATRWNDWSNGGNFQTQFCRSMRAYTTAANGLVLQNPFTAFIRSLEDVSEPDPTGLGSGTVYDPWTLANDPGFLPPLNIFCDFIKADSFLFEPRSNQELLFTGSSWWQRTRMDGFKSLRVPRLSLNVLPDTVMPGDSNTDDAEIKPLELERIRVNGKEELLLTVRIRQSDLNQGRLEFDVPVFAVNGRGELLENANGLFNAQFAGDLFESWCDDCAMVNGQARIKVQIDPRLYGPGSNRKLELNRVTIWGDNPWDDTNKQPVCDSNQAGDVWKASKTLLLGCATIDATNESPDGAEFVPPSAYPGELQSSVVLGGEVLLGDVADAIRETLATTEAQFWGYVKTFVKGLPFIGNWAAMIEYGLDCYAQATSDPNRECNMSGFLTAAAGALFDAIGGRIIGGVISGLTRAGASIAKSIAPLLATAAKVGTAIKTTTSLQVASASRALGTFAKLVESLFKTWAQQGVRNMDTMLTRLDGLLGGMVSALKQGGRSMRVQADQLLKKMMKAPGEIIENALTKTRAFLEGVGEYASNFARACKLAQAKRVLGTFVSFAAPAAIQLAVGTGVGIGVNMSLGWVAKQFTGESVEPSDIDNARTRSSATRATQRSTPLPNRNPCWKSSKSLRAHLLERAPYHKDKSNWKELVPFIGQRVTNANGTPNLPHGYGYAPRGKYGNYNVDRTKAFCIPEPANACDGKVQILEADDGFWSLPKPDSTGRLDNRIAIEGQYKKNHKNAYPVFLRNSSGSTIQNIHHMIADNVWKRVPMLRQAMQRCNLHMDLAENLLEMATEAVHLDSVEGRTARDPKSGTTVTARVGTNYAVVIHSGQHPQFDKFVEDRIKTEANDRLPIGQNDSYWADDSKCSVMKEVIDEIQNEIRSILTLGKPKSTLSTFADEVTSPNGKLYFKLRNTQ